MGEHFEGCQDIPLRPGGNAAIYVIFKILFSLVVSYIFPAL